MKFPPPPMISSKYISSDFCETSPENLEKRFLFPFMVMAAGMIEKSSLSNIFSSSMSLLGIWKNLIFESAYLEANDFNIVTASSVLMESLAVTIMKQSFESLLPQLF